MCEQCSASTTTLGEFAPGWHLVRATAKGRVMAPGQYALVRGDDPDYYLEGEPAPAPAGDTIDDPASGPAWDAFFDAADRLAPSLMGPPEAGFALYSACIEAGYIANGECLPLFDQWLCDRLGRLIRDAREKEDAPAAFNPGPAIPWTQAGPAAGIPSDAMDDLKRRIYEDEPR